MNYERRLKLHDLIKIDRGYYYHWAIYVGDGYVAHFGSISAGSLSSTFTLFGHLRNPGSLKVEVVLLSEVAGEHEWFIDNCTKEAYAKGLNRLPDEEISENINDALRSRLDYDLFGLNCEAFATSMRYGDGFSKQNMDYQKHPNRHDLIMINRGHYYHYAIYLGDGYVAHFGSTSGGSFSSTVSSSTRPSGPLTNPRGDKVEVVLLSKVAGDHKWFVNNHTNEATAKGLERLPDAQISTNIIKALRSRLDYNLFGLNCEAFATMMRYGNGFSKQAEEAAPYALGTLFGILAMSVLALMGLARR